MTSDPAVALAELHVVAPILGAFVLLQHFGGGGSPESSLTQCSWSPAERSWFAGPWVLCSLAFSSSSASFHSSLLRTEHHYAHRVRVPAALFASSVGSPFFVQGACGRPVGLFPEDHCSFLWLVVSQWQHHSFLPVEWVSQRHRWFLACSPAE